MNTQTLVTAALIIAQMARNPLLQSNLRMVVELSSTSNSVVVTNGASLTLKIN